MRTPDDDIIDASAYVPAPEIGTYLHGLLGSTDKGTRRATARALTKARDPAAIPELMSELESADGKERAEAAGCLAFHDISAVVEKIRVAFDCEEDGETRFWLSWTYWSPCRRISHFIKNTLAISKKLPGTIRSSPPR